MTGMLMTAADGLGMNCVALPWACSELFVDAALKLENLDSLLLVCRPQASHPHTSPNLT